MKMQTKRRESMVAGETGSTFYRRQKPIYQEKSADSAPLCLVFITISTCCLPGGRNNALAEQYLHLVFSHPSLRWLAFIRLVSRVLFRVCVLPLERHMKKLGHSPQVIQKQCLK